MHIRKKRPTLMDVNDYFKHGHYTVNKSDYVTNEERIKEAQRISQELYKIASKSVPRTRNLEYMILKCHLIIEYALTQYIRFFSEPVVEPKDIRFSFSQKLDIAYFMGFGTTEPTLIPSIELLNRARNQVAHSFILDKSILNELIRINSEDHDDFTLPSPTEQIRALRQITHAVCGITSGFIIARSFFSLSWNEDKIRRNDK